MLNEGQVKAYNEIMAFFTKGTLPVLDKKTFKTKEAIQAELDRHLTPYNLSYTLSGRPGCVDRETQYLSPEGWKYICHYTEGEQVMQIDPVTFEGTWVTPTYVKEPCEEFFRFKNESTDQMLSMDHDIAYVTPSGLAKVRTSMFVLGEIPVKVLGYFKYQGKALEIAPEELYERAKTTEDFSPFMWCSEQDAKIILSAIEGREFETLTQESADALQYIYNLLGIRVNISKITKETIWYKNGEETRRVVLDKNLLVTKGSNLLTLNPQKAELVPSVDGYKYCFETQTGYLVLRRNGKVFVTGNSGKTYLLAEIFNHLDEETRAKVHFTATTNKATLEVKKAIGAMTGWLPNDDSHLAIQTIYKKLRLSVTRVFNKRSLQWEELILPYGGEFRERHLEEMSGGVLVIDEASFIDNRLLKFIHQAQREYNIKVLYVGDKNQLCPVGSTDTPVFSLGYAITELTQIMRQRDPHSHIVKYTEELRKVIVGQSVRLPRLIPTGDIIKLTDREFVAKLAEAYTNGDDFKCIAMTNAKVNKYNQLLLDHVRGNKYLEAGDTATVNSHAPPFYTDEVVLVTEAVETSYDFRCSLEDKTKKLPDGTYEMFYDKTYTDIKGRDVTVSNGVQEETFFVPNSHSVTKQVLELGGPDEQKITPKRSLKIADIRSTSALTVHKSQGGSYETVFLDLSSFKSSMDTVELARLLYVAFSRARTTVYLKGNVAGIVQAK